MNRPMRERLPLARSKLFFTRYLKGQHLVFDGTSHHEALDAHSIQLPESVDAIDSLILNSRIPEQRNNMNKCENQNGAGGRQRGRGFVDFVASGEGKYVCRMCV